MASSLKTGHGPDAWMGFFAKAGSAFAFLENCPRVPEHAHMSRFELMRELVQEAENLKIIDTLSALTVAAPHFRTQKASYYLLILRLDEGLVDIQVFGRDELSEATERYSEAERDFLAGKPTQVVLVAASSLDSLQKAYPNYFVNTQSFIDEMNRISDYVEAQTKRRRTLGL